MCFKVKKITANSADSKIKVEPDTFNSLIKQRLIIIKKELLTNYGIKRPQSNSSCSK